MLSDEPVKTPTNLYTNMSLLEVAVATKGLNIPHMQSAAKISDATPSMLPFDNIRSCIHRNIVKHRRRVLELHKHLDALNPCYPVARKETEKAIQNERAQLDDLFSALGDIKRLEAVAPALRGILNEIRILSQKRDDILRHNCLDKEALGFIENPTALPDESKESWRIGYDSTPRKK